MAGIVVSYIKELAETNMSVEFEKFDMSVEFEKFDMSAEFSIDVKPMVITFYLLAENNNILITEDGLYIKI